MNGANNDVVVAFGVVANVDLVDVCHHVELV